MGDAMSDREPVSGNLPAEFAERASDPVDAWAWQRARQRYELPRRETMPQIIHILLDHSRHFLVVDGTRGDVALTSDEPAIHPAGFARFRSDYAGYRVPKALLGRTLNLVEIEAKEVSPEPAEQVEQAWKAFHEASAAAIEAATARWPEAKP